MASPHRSIRKGANRPDTEPWRSNRHDGPVAAQTSPCRGIPRHYPHPPFCFYTPPGVEHTGIAAADGRFMSQLRKARPLGITRAFGCTLLCWTAAALFPLAAAAHQVRAGEDLSLVVAGKIDPVATSPDPALELIQLVPSRPTAEIHGIVTDPSGDIVPGADVRLESGKSSETQVTVAAADGSFAFTHVPEGPYRISVTSAGFKPFLAIGSLNPGQVLSLPEIALPITTVATEIEVSASRQEIAAAQLSLEEKQRVLGIFPNFYATYIWDAEPLSPRQKFSLAWKFSVDPVSVGMAGFMAGTEQAENEFSGYGQGARGYGKRFGAVYTDGFTSTMLGQAIFPVIFRQDPRYFVKGTGSLTARALYAIETTVICKGDSGHWQPNYSNVLGNVASASISNAYYPASNRHGATLTLENSMFNTALGAAGGLIQEFFLHHMTPHVPDYAAIAHN